MTNWGFPDFDAHEGVHLFTDPASGLQAVIAVHSTADLARRKNELFRTYASIDPQDLESVRNSCTHVLMLRCLANSYESMA